MAHYFIAIQLPENLQHYFSGWQDELQKKLTYKQWTHKEDLHITLQFLGEVDDNRIKQLQAELQEMERVSAFDVEVGSLGTFGNPNKPRVLWAGVNKIDALQQLQKRVTTCTMNVGFPIEAREYTPHITLAKKWDGAEALAEGMLANLKEARKQETCYMNVSEVVLFRIHPQHTPKYEVVERYRLQ